MSCSSRQLTLKKGAPEDQGVRYMRAACQLPGRGPLMWMMPEHVNKKSDNDMMIELWQPFCSAEWNHLCNFRKRAS